MNAIPAFELDMTMRAMQLKRLLEGMLPAHEWLKLPDDVDITDLSSDSRALAAGGLFVALAGLRQHGLEFAEQAVANGALAILWEPADHVDAPAFPGVAAIPVRDLAQRIGTIADRFFLKPSAALKVVAITGTNGKTTTAHLFAAAMEKLGLAAGYMGTLGYGRLGALQTATHTTPDCINVHRHLAELRDTGAHAVGMEVSSHALHQGRINATRIDTAVFTNLTRDHLDYHGTLEAYGAAKARLFHWPGLSQRVINIGNEFGRRLLIEAVREGRSIAYSITPQAASCSADACLRAKQVRLAPHGVEIDVESTWGAATLRSQLLGHFNAENLLAVLAVLLGWKIPLAEAVKVLEQVSAPPGRMELHSGPTGKRAVVDYAHTPDALEKVLQSLRQHCRGQLICVFGCGGDRDAGKRPMMGAIAEQLADRVIITDDNPRSEDPRRIVADILRGLQKRDAVIVEHDRAGAIDGAIVSAGVDDLVLIAGKGHEDYQIVGSETRHFSDREAVMQSLREHT